MGFLSFLGSSMRTSPENQEKQDALSPFGRVMSVPERTAVGETGHQEGGVLSSKVASSSTRAVPSYEKQEMPRPGSDFRMSNASQNAAVFGQAGLVSTGSSIKKYANSIQSVRSMRSVSTAADAAPLTQDGKPCAVIGYYSSSDLRGDAHAGDRYTLMPFEIPAERLTHLIYGYAKVLEDGSIVSTDVETDLAHLFPGDPGFVDDFGFDHPVTIAAKTRTWKGDRAPFYGVYRQLNLLKERHPDLKTILSVGGWGNSEWLSKVASTKETRFKFASNCLAYLKKYGFDGVNIEWQFPVEGGDVETHHSSLDSKNLVALLETLKQELRESFILVVTVPATPALARHFMAYAGYWSPFVDMVHVVAMDLRGTWSTTTGHVSPMYMSTRDPCKGQFGTAGPLDTIGVIRRYSKSGVPIEKMVLGVGFYGRAFGGVVTHYPNGDNGDFVPRADGLFCEFDALKTPSGTLSGNQAKGVWLYSDLRRRLKMEPGWIEMWDDQCKASYAFNPREDIFVSFESVQSLRWKAKFVAKNGLAGIVCNAMFGDVRDDPFYADDCELTQGGWHLLDVAVQYLIGQTWQSRVPRPFFVGNANNDASKVITLSRSPEPLDPVDESPISDSPVYVEPLPTGRRVVGHFTNWSIYQRGYLPNMIPFGELTHLHYCFADVKEDGTVVASDEWTDLDRPFVGDAANNADPSLPHPNQPVLGCMHQINYVFKPRFHHLKTLISIGGWQFSANFSAIALNDALRKRFARNAVEFMRRHGFDGIDLVWQYPVEGGQDGNSRNELDGFGWAATLLDLRKELDRMFALDSKKSNGRLSPYLLSAALPCHPRLLKHMPASVVVDAVDYFNLLSFDFRGATWSKMTGHHTALYPDRRDPELREVGTVYDAIMEYLSEGVRPDQINIGTATYGRGFAGLKLKPRPAIKDRPGLYEKFKEIPTGTWDLGLAPGDVTGVFDYWDVMLRFAANPSSELKYYWDEDVNASYLLGEVEIEDGTKRSLFISYDDARSVEAKCQLVNAWQLSGVSIWDLSGDVRSTQVSDETPSLVSTIVRTFQQQDVNVPAWLSLSPPKSQVKVPELLPPHWNQSGSNLTAIAEEEEEEEDDVETQRVAVASPAKITSPFGGITGSTAMPSDGNFPKYLVGYFISWGIYARGYRATDIPIERITHLNYAFARIQDGTWAVQIGDSYADTEYLYPGQTWDPSSRRGNFGYINFELKKRNPNFKSLISIGGWTWSGNFSTMARTDAGRKAFARSCADFVDRWGFDGVDLDWEYPVKGGLDSNTTDPNDGRNYTLVLQDIRDALGALTRRTGKKYLLTIASPANPELITFYESAKLTQILDFMNIMTYDYRGGWSKATGHQTPLYPSTRDPFPELGNTVQAVDQYIRAGFAPDKIVIGATMYGRGFQGVRPGNLNGLFQSYSSVPMGTWDALGNEGATGVFDYKDIIARNMPSYWDDEVKAAWVYDPNRQGGLMISYDDPRSIKEKCWYVNAKKLGGLMFWELTGDLRPGSQGCLLDTMVTFLGNGSVPDGPRPGLSTSTGGTTTTSPGGTTTNPATGDTGGSTSNPPLITTSPASDESSAIAGGKRVVAYFISWGIYARGYKATDIPIESITHLNYAFARIQDGTWAVQLGDQYADTEYLYPGQTWDPNSKRGNFGYINFELKKRNPSFKSLISIGGWTWSGNFSTMARTDANRKAFARSCADFVDKWGFDGVDLDWEYPVKGGLESNVVDPSDGKNLTLMLQEVRNSLNALTQRTGKQYLLTIASPANPELITFYESSAIGKILDFMNVMTYDYRGGWSRATGHHTPLYPSTKDPYPELGCSQQAIDQYIKAGFPKEKICIGAAMYGRGFQGVQAGSNNGLFQPYSSIPMGTWDALGNEGATGVFDYKDVVARNMLRYWDDEVKAVYVYDPNLQGGLMISMDDPRSISEKCWFVNAKGLGGVMFWELSGDVRAGARNAGLPQAQSLLNRIVEVLKSGAVPDGPRPGIDNTKPPVVDPPIQPPPVVDPPVQPPPVVNPPPVVQPPVEPPPGNTGAKAVVAYYTYWSALAGYTPDQIPFDQITHLNYAFATVNSDGSVVAGDEFSDLQRPYGDGVLGAYRYINSVLKPMYPNLKTGLSIGGFSGSNTFPQALSSMENMSRFSTTAVQMMTTYGFNGLDICWEWPGLQGRTSGNVNQDLTMLGAALSRIRIQLDNLNRSSGKSYYLTISLPAMDALVADFNLSSIMPSLDWMNLRSYDLRDGSSPITGHAAPLKVSTGQAPLSVSRLLDMWLQKGAPAAKIALGIPFYGRAWTGIEAGSNNGLWTPVTAANVPEPPTNNSLTVGSNAEKGQFTYRYIKRLLNQKKLSMKWDNEAQAAYGYCAETKMFVSFDNRKAVDAKCAFINEKKLAGAMVFDISSDSKDEELISAIAANLITGAGCGPDACTPGGGGNNGGGNNGGGNNGGGGSPDPPLPPAPTTNVLVGYYLSQTGQSPINFPIASVQVESMTHLIYGSAVVRNNQVVWQNPTVDAANLTAMKGPLRQRNSKIRYLLSVADRGSDTGVSQLINAGNAATVQSFAQQCVQFVAANGLDGVFLEYKWPTNAAQGQSLATLCQSIRSAMNQAGGSRQFGILTPWISAWGNMQSPSVFMPFNSLSQSVDFFVVQTFDFVAPGTPAAQYQLTGHNSHITLNMQSDTLRFTSIVVTIDGYRTAGVPANKLILGVPLFGRAFDGLPNDWHNGLYLFYSKLGTGAPGYGSNILPYHQIAKLITDGRIKDVFDSASRASYAWGTGMSTVPSMGYFITYDNVQAVQEKVKFIRERGLMGAMAWELSGDPSSVLIGELSKQLA